MNLFTLLKKSTYAAVALLLASNVSAQNDPSNGNLRYTAFPPSNAESAPPLVMMTLSRDHQYFFKAYNDYSDVDPENNDGIETTYDNSFSYYGYFDQERCYDYDTGAGRFEAEDFQNAGGYCDTVSGDWSGNFLNWATMSRMDVLRKIFYGGTRSTDTATATVLERAFLPTDAHSFAKYYNGDDIDGLTPYSLDSDGSGGNNDGIDDLNEGITICNTSYSTVKSHESTAPPLMRVARGNYQLWAANERWQCTWENERGVNFNGNIAAGLIDGNGNPVATTVTIGTETVDVTSGINAYNRDPIAAHSLPNTGATQAANNSNRDFIVRIEVCADGLTANNNERCREYPDGNFKPSGLMHAYGETGLMSFGLMTGSYSNNTEGGVLRKNISDFNDEVNATTDGTFTGVDGIVSSIDLFRIFGYSPEQNGVYFGSQSDDNCSFQLTNIVNGNCNSWGNPISEIYKESIRYISGLTPTGAFAASDNGLINGLVNVAWEDPIATENQCAPLNNIVVNASVSSYDDNSNAINDLAGSPNVDSVTDQVGGFEGINGNSFFVGVSDTGNDELCTAKTVGGLSDVTGLCPEGPTVNGTYSMAGMSYYAKNNDLRTEIAIEGDQTLDTYGITLATNTPIITVPLGVAGVATQSMTILPAYRLLIGDEGGGALVDFKIVEPHTQISPGVFRGRYYVVWEDSEQGGDFDMDVLGTLTYELDTTAGEITVTTNAISQSTGGGQLFGFIINGTTQDGFHAYSGILGANFTDTTGVPGCTNCQALFSGFNGNRTAGGQEGPQSHTFTLSASGAGALEAPLYYAAKYGSFDDPDADGPDSVDEWDRINNNTGELGADGLPDNYFEVTNPAQLETSLGNALAAILANRASSGTAPANLANADGTGGIIVQALYFDTEKGLVDPNQVVNWTGELHAFFVDEFGFFREDNPTAGVQGQLDGFDVDKIFTYYFDELLDEDQLRINRFNLQNNLLPFDSATNPVDTTPANVETVSAREINTIWSAGEILSSYGNANIENQRTYGTPVATGSAAASRHIITWFDQNRDGLVDSGEQVDFVRGTVGTTDDAGVDFGRYLGVTNMNRARRIIDFIRGQDGQNATRSRLITEDQSGSNVDVIRRLGDVVNSTPHIVSAPTGSYDIRYGDSSYSEFRQQYQGRRQVMYIGGNDGLLHAFNVGFRDASPTSPIKFSKTNPHNASDVAHELGAELWAYAPNNLLPHLKWLEEPFYSHVFYVDGVPTSYDVNIFPDDADHPNGWGTILVVGMRLGGGQIGLNLDSNSSNDISNACRDWCSRSAYIVLDVTNPEKPPVVLAEINDNMLAANAGTDLWHTHMTPALIKKRVAGAGNNWLSPTENEWKLIFGSGPKSLADLDTNEAARYYEYDLGSNSLTKSNVKRGAANESRSFVGDMRAVDWNNDYEDDVVYFGTVGKINGSPDIDDHKGSLFRYLPASGTTNRMFNPNRPISTKPLVRSRGARDFVYFGTGRYLHQGDSETDKQEIYYGLMEPVDSGGVSDYQNTIPNNATILDVDEITVDIDGNIGGTIPSLVPASVNTFSSLQNFILNATGSPLVNGWKRELEYSGTLPSERISAGSVSVRSQLFFTSFTPTDNICAAESGQSNLSVIDLITGTPTDFGGLGFDASGNAIATLDLGSGRASFPQVLIASGLGDNKGRIIIQMDSGEFAEDPDEVGPPIVTLGAPSSVERVNWREIRSE